MMDYHLLTKKCDGMCDSCECPPAELADPMLNPDIAALTKRLAADPEFAAQVAGLEVRPPTPVGWSDTDWLAYLERVAACPPYALGPLPETGWD